MILDRIRPSIRLLCGGIGAFLLSGAVVYFRAYGLEGAAPLGLLAAGFLTIGSTGSLEDEAEPARSADAVESAATVQTAGFEPMREFADPARSLSPDTFGPATPVRDSVRQPL